MIRPARRFLPFLLIALLTSVTRAGLRESIELAVKTADLGAATVGVSVRRWNGETDRELVGINASTPFIPASNMKLITTGSALLALGPEFRFETRMIREGDRIIIVGGGDPAFGDPELLKQMEPRMDVEGFLKLWVEAIVGTGLRNIREIVVDDRIFDRELVHPLWPAEQLNRRYCAQVAGLNFHLNVLHFYPSPGANAGRPSLEVFHPYAPWLSPTNKASSKGGKGARNSIWIARPPNGNRLSFYGNVKHAYRTPVPVTVHDMPKFFGELLGDRLKKRGIEAASIRVMGADEMISTGESLGPVISTPLSTILTRCNRDSQNMYAESLLKRVARKMTGRPGSWRDGSAVIRHLVLERLEKVELVSGLVVSDGSGMSRENRVTPRLLSAWLGSFLRDESLRDTMMESLAVAEESGTLKKRFKNTDLHGGMVRAKSGYIRGVSCLSGYVSVPGRGTMVFSVMVNDLKSGAVAKAKRMQEKIAGIIAEHLAGQAVAVETN